MNAVNPAYHAPGIRRKARWRHRRRRLLNLIDKHPRTGWYVSAVLAVGFFQHVFTTWL